MAASLDIPPKKNGFQSFSLYSGTSSIMVSHQLMQQVNCRIVQKYLPIDYFISSITNRYFYMADPSSWDDVFEMKYLDVLTVHTHSRNIPLAEHSFF